MTEYVPDKWVVIEITTPDYTIRKVLASYWGSYLDSDSWRVSSGITKVVPVKDHYIFHNESGSTYECFKYRQGMSAYTASVFESWVRELPTGTTMTIVEDYNE